jgi:hypothetical protein
MARRNTESGTKNRSKVKDVNATAEDSILLIYTLIRESVTSQYSRKSTLETKAGTLIAFAGGMFALLMGARETILLTPQTSKTLILVSVSLFAGSVVFSNFVTWVRQYREDPDPNKLAQHYLERSERETRLQVISNLINTWQTNHRQLERIAIYLRLAFLTQAIAFILLGIGLFFSI